MNQRQQRALFTAYWLGRVREAGAITPGQKLALLDQIERELHGADETKPGKVRLPREGGGSVLLPADHPLVRAALDGQPVAAGGMVIRQQRAAETPGERLRTLNDVQKVLVVVGIFLVPLLLFGLVLGLRSSRRVPQFTATPVISILPPFTPTATATMTATLVPTLPAPSPTAQVVVATPTPYSLALISGQAAPSGNDPASVEVGGFSYILAAGQVSNGQWTPQGAEWLVGTTLRRVVSIPYEPEVANAVAALRAGAVVRLRLRSGEIVKYRVVEVRRQPRQGIEILADRTPSLALLLHGEPSAERWVVVADAIQEPSEFSVVAAGATDPTSPGMDGSGGDIAPSVPTLVPTDSATVITSTQVLTHTDVGLALAVGRCERVEQIGEQSPPRNQQQFLICDVTLRALDTATGTVPFSADALAITEETWITTQLDWWPPTVGVSRALRSGTLAPGSTTSGRVAGVVNQASSSPIGGRRSQPVLVWEQAGRRFLIQVQP